MAAQETTTPYKTEKIDGYSANIVTIVGPNGQFDFSQVTSDREFDFYFYRDCETKLSFSTDLYAPAGTIIIKDFSRTIRGFDSLRPSPLILQKIKPNIEFAFKTRDNLLTWLNSDKVKTVIFPQ